MAVTVQELAEHFKLSENALSQQVSDDHITETSTFLGAWKLIAPHLGLSQEEVEAVDNDGESEQHKTLLTLQKWKQALFFKATYQTLLEALLAAKRADLAGEVCKMMARYQCAHDQKEGEWIDTFFYTTTSSEPCPF